MSTDQPPIWNDADMAEAWRAGAQWVLDRTEIIDGELSLPEDNLGCEGLDWMEAAGAFLDDYEAERA